jgi:hypothetical protein
MEEGNHNALVYRQRYGENSKTRCGAYCVAIPNDEQRGWSYIVSVKSKRIRTHDA